MTAPPCAGKSQLFDSRTREDHERAKQLCRECPVLAACLANLEAVKRAPSHLGGSPEGTWAGQLVGGVLNGRAMGQIARRQREKEAKAP